METWKQCNVCPWLHCTEEPSFTLSIIGSKDSRRAICKASIREPLPSIEDVDVRYACRSIRLALPQDWYPASKWSPNWSICLTEGTSSTSALLTGINTRNMYPSFIRLLQHRELTFRSMTCIVYATNDEDFTVVAVLSVYNSSRSRKGVMREWSFHSRTLWAWTKTLRSSFYPCKRSSCRQHLSVSQYQAATQQTENALNACSQGMWKQHRER